MVLSDSIRDGDLVCLWDGENSFYILLQPGSTFTTHKGIIRHDDIRGRRWGERVRTHKGSEYLLMKPSLYEIVMYAIQRKTQIVYPKDSGLITLKLGLRPGMKVLEAGVGSGALTLVMANTVAPTGMIYAYERDRRFLALADENLRMAGLRQFVTLLEADILEGIEEDNFDAAFIDMREPWETLPILKSRLKATSPVGFILPTTNQVSNLLHALYDEGFLRIEVEEIIHRPYKPVPDRLRPVDRMSAHTGYLIFARTPAP